MGYLPFRRGGRNIGSMARGAVPGDVAPDYVRVLCDTGLLTDDQAAQAAAASARTGTDLDEVLVSLGFVIALWLCFRRRR